VRHLATTCTARAWPHYTIGHDAGWFTVWWVCGRSDCPPGRRHLIGEYRTAHDAAMAMGDHKAAVAATAAWWDYQTQATP
jgi:hypothetical protein